MLTTIVIKGALGDKYGKQFEFDIKTPLEALRGLGSQIKGFYKDFEKGNYSIFKGKEKLTKELLSFPVGKNNLIFAPVIQGSATGAEVLLFSGARDFIGAALSVPFQAAGSIISWFYPEIPDFGELESPDQRSSFIFNGAVNISSQGTPVPLVYGQMRTGSVVVSAGINTEEV